MDARHRPGWAFVLVLGVAVPTTSVAAQPRTSDPMTTRALSIDGEILAGASRSGRAGTGCVPGPGGTMLCDDGTVRHRPFGVLSLDAHGRALRIGRESDALFLELDASLRLGLVEAYRDDGSWRGAWLSIWFGGAVARRTTSLTLRGAVGIAPPLRTLVQSGVADARLAAGWGQWDHWLALEQVVPFGFLGLAEGRFGDFDVGGDVAIVLAPSFPLGGSVANPGRGLFFWTGLGGWVTAHVGEVVRLGLRAQGVLSLHDGVATTCDDLGFCTTGRSVRTDFQASVLPFVRVLLPPGYVELRLQINLDEPEGPFIVGEQSTWAVALRAGASWDP